MWVQVKIHKLLMESRYRTVNKSLADFFFVPAYVKCVRIFGGLTEEEVNDHFLKVSLKQNIFLIVFFRLLFIRIYIQV